MALGQSLFRQEAIDFQRGQRDFGEITLLQPVSTKLLAWLLTAVVAAAIVFLCFAQFSRKQTVAGFLIPAAGTMKVFPTREGVVSELHVEEGQHVEAGDPLFTVATPEVAADGEDVNAAKLASMRHQKEMLEGQIAAEQRTEAAERERLKVLIASSEAEIGDIRRQIEIQTERIQIAESLVSAARELLTKGYMSAVEGRRREDTLLEQRQNLVALRRQLAEKQNKLAETEYSLAELPTATARRVQPLRDEVAMIEQRRAEAKGRSSYIVRAPAAGRVAMLQVRKGQTVQPQRLQLEIVPENSPLRAELLIPTRAAGFVRVGQEVRLLYDAFPHQNFGAYHGRIAELSNTVVTKADATGPIAPEEPVYKATAVLDRPDVDANGRKVPLQAGMLLQAKIILDRRSLVRWILDPLLNKRL
jgi:membrane fusion protein